MEQTYEELKTENKVLSDQVSDLILKQNEMFDYIRELEDKLGIEHE